MKKTERVSLSVPCVLLFSGVVMVEAGWGYWSPRSEIPGTSSSSDRMPLFLLTRQTRCDVRGVEFLLSHSSAIVSKQVD